MSFSITTAFVAQFTQNVAHIAQQRESRLRGCVMEVPVHAEDLFFDQIGPVDARKKTSRTGDSPIMDSQHLRRRCVPEDYEWGDLITQQDKARTLDDPTNSYVQNGGMAMQRAFDDEIIAATFGTAYTGKAGATANTWPNGNAESTPAQAAGTQIAVSDWTGGVGTGNAGLTVAKMLNANACLDRAEGDENEERYMVLSATDKLNLLKTTEATNSDYTAVQALNDGRIKKFCGFNIIHSERTLLNSSGYRRIPAWRKSGIMLGVLLDTWGRVTERPDKSFAIYAYCSESIGATRVEENKVVEVICLNS